MVCDEVSIVRVHLYRPCTHITRQSFLGKQSAENALGTIPYKATRPELTEMDEIVRLTMNLPMATVLKVLGSYPEVVYFYVSGSGRN